VSSSFFFPAFYPPNILFQQEQRKTFGFSFFSSLNPFFLALLFNILSYDFSPARTFCTENFPPLFSSTTFKGTSLAACLFFNQVPKIALLFPFFSTG